MKKQALILGILALLALLITLAVFNTIQDVLLPPLASAFRQIRFLVSVIWRSQDQFLIWYLFVYIAVLLSIHTLLQIFPARKEERGQVETYHGPVQTWIHNLETFDEGMYYRWRFAQHIREIMEKNLAFQQGLAPENVRRAIKDGDVEVHPVFLDYLQATYSTDINKYFSTYREKDKADPIRDLPPEQILAYMEDVLEDPGGTP